MAETETLDTADEATTPATATTTTTTETAETDAPAPYWPDDWRSRMAGSDDKMLKHLNRFASPEGVYKSWRQYEQKRNDGRLQPSRPDTTDEAALAEWRKAVGAPDSPEGYLADLPAEINIDQADEAALKEVFRVMHAEGIPTNQAKAVVGKYYEMVTHGLEQRAHADSEFRATAEDHLRSEWGPEYRQNLNAIGLMMESHGDAELFGRLQEARFADGHRLGDDPGVLKFLAGLAREVHPDGFLTVTPSAGMSRGQAIDDEIATLEREMGDTRGRDPAGYWNNAGKQNRYRELLQARERASARGR